MAETRARPATERSSRVAQRWAQPLGWLAAVVWMTLLFLGLNAPLLEGRAAPIWDALDYYAPAQILVADHARAGRLLFWNPWSQAGVPDFADPQSGAFSPVTIALGALTGGSTTGFCVLWLFVWWLGGMGMLAFSRALGAPPWGGLVVALGWLFSGLYTGEAEHTAIVSSVSFLPLVIWRFDAALRGRWSAALQAGALWGLSGLHGYPALTILTPCFAALWGIGRAVAGGGPRAARPLRVVSALGVLAAIGGLVFAPALLGLVRETRGYSDRAVERQREAALNSNALAPGAVATLSSPYLPFLKLNYQELWSVTDVSGCSLYAGAAVIGLAAMALLRRRGAWRWFLAGAALLGLAFAVGGALPLRGWLYDWFPPSRYFRHAALFRVYTVFSIAVLAALGAADLERALCAADRRALGTFAWATAALAALAIGAYAAVERSVSTWAAHLWLGRAHLVGVWAGLAIAAHVRPTRHRRWLLPAALVALASLDAVGAHRLPGLIWSTQSGMVFRWNAFQLQRSDDLDLTSRGLARSFEVEVERTPSGMNVLLKIPTLLGYHALSNRFQKRWLEVPSLLAAALEERGGRPRSWFARDAPEVAVNDETWARFAERAEESDALPLVVHRPDAMLDAGDAGATGPDPATWPTAEPLPVRVTRYVPEELAFEANVPAAGWLLVTDRWSRSWRATIDGQPVPVFGGDFLFRAVRVHEGTNHVRFTYEPRGYRALLAASWSTLAGVGAISALDGWRRIRRRGERSG